MSMSKAKKKNRKEMGNEQRCRTVYAEPRKPRAWRKWVFPRPKGVGNGNHQVWAAGLHDAANCFHDALKAKWKLESQRKVKPKTNGGRIRDMTDEELAKSIVRHFLLCKKCFFKRRCEKDPTGVCIECVLTFLRSPVEETE